MHKTLKVNAITNTTQRIISFLVLAESSLYGRTMEFITTTSEGTLTSLPEAKDKMIRKKFTGRISEAVYSHKNLPKYLIH